MKKQYLYQGWAGNTYSHKCKNTNENTASNIEYLDISGLDRQIRAAIIALSFLVKVPEIRVISPVGKVISEAPAYLQNVTEIAILLQEKMVKSQYDVPIMTIEQFLIEQGLDPNTIPRITKEEFYTFVA